MSKKEVLRPKSEKIWNQRVCTAFAALKPVILKARACLGAPGSMIEHMAKKSPATGAPSLDDARLRQQAIGAKLRQMFDEVVNEPVPDEFFEILRRADARGSENGG